MARFLYFAWLRERLGKPAEEYILPESVTTVGQMIQHMRERGEPYATVLADTHLRVAVNQHYASPEVAVDNGCEIALFPPVSGGSS
ncbi:MAG: molybdopterin converting factor subunit 1 [Magnetococcales bacterium]|nr:molybdopterin converting factor subunit 1 [Magnetococcales bacterium]NGZ27189.1 molybdopterin converting factor subunit 1 [Magnetococcales bacterium]